MLTIYEEEQLDYWVWGPATRAVTWRRPTPNPLTRWAIQMNFLKASSYTVLSSRFGHQNSLPALPQRSCLGLLPCNLRELLVHQSSSTAARTAPVTVMYPSSCAAHSDWGICSTIGMGWSISPLTAGKTFVAVQLTAPFWGPPLIDGGGRVSSMFYHTASRPELGVSHPLMACLLQEVWRQWTGLPMNCTRSHPTHLGRHGITMHVTLRSGLDMAGFPMRRGTHLECNDTQRVSGANLH